MDQNDHTMWMQRCLELAELAREHGDPPVGTVIIFNGDIVAEAAEQVNSQQDISAHSELVAIKIACKALGTLNLAGCTLITNVEPCWMCSYAIRETGITSLVVGRTVDDIGGITSRYPILTDATIDGWKPPPSIEWYDISTFQVK